MPQHTSQNTAEPNTHAIALRVLTASSAEKLKNTVKCSTSSGTHQKYVGSQTPVRSASDSQVTPTNSTADAATKATTPKNLPVSSSQRGTGLATSTATEPGSRNAGRNPAVQARVSNRPAESATQSARIASTLRTP